MPCVDCKHWRLRVKTEDLKMMSRLGFASCDLGEKWVFWPARHDCEKWKGVGKDASEKRREWLERVKA